MNNYRLYWGLIDFMSSSCPFVSEKILTYIEGGNENGSKSELAS